MNELAKAISKNLLKHDPEIEQRIQTGIETNRKGSGTIKVNGADGKPVEKCKITLRHTKHEFHFGCNGFMHNQFEESERNAAHDEAFRKLFNLVVVPFYWSDTEPEKGNLRFDIDSEKSYRRPATDELLAFCDKYNITPKGHPLCWDHFLPSWLPLDQKGIARETERRIREIAERYGDRIQIWDVCNEALNWNPLNIGQRVPDRHVEFAFEVASKYLPRSSVLTYNDYACWKYHGDYTPMYMLGRHLKNSDVNFGALGLQFHMFGRPVKDMHDEADGRLNPRYLYACLDQYGKLGVPVNISEITITAHQDLGDGLAFQKEVTEQLYRIWFSHEAMNGIIWWNLVDDTAYVNPNNPGWDENIYKGGLVNNDLTPKPAYNALQRLINEEWTTDLTLDYDCKEQNRFRGFYGEYEAVVKTDQGESVHPLKLSKGSVNDFSIQLS